MVDVFIGLGSNLGDREDNLRRAIELLKQKMKLVKVSSLYESEPMYVKDQPWFCELCRGVRDQTYSEKNCWTIFMRLKESWADKESVRYGPRSIDLDILFYGNEVVEKSGLKIPHPMIQERRFVLVPLAEIYPDYIHPVYRSSISTLLS